VQRLISVRAELKHSVIDKAVDRWRPKLWTHVRDKGEQSENSCLIESLFFSDFLGLVISFFGDYNFFHTFCHVVFDMMTQGKSNNHNHAMTILILFQQSLTIWHTWSLPAATASTAILF